MRALQVSSAHVYLRLNPGQTLEEVGVKSLRDFILNKCFHKNANVWCQVAQSVIVDAAQLVKANSITGNKMNDVDVVRGGV